MRTFQPKLTNTSAIFFVSLICCLFASGNAGHFEVPKCANRDDGFYSEGCNGRYFGCANKITVYVKCPDNLFFNEVAQKCDYMENVHACHGNETEPRKPVVAETPKIKSCKGRKNGAYILESCSQKYLVCSDEVAWISTCSGDLFFDARTKRCENKERLPTCNVGSLSTAEVEELSAAGGEMVCVGRPNGIIPLKCSPRYYVCANEATFLLSCPGETVFDEEKLECNYPKKVTSCIGIHITTTTTLPVIASTTKVPSPISSTVSVASLKTSTVPETTTSTGAVASPILGQTRINFCIGKDDGHYARESCSPNYYSCSNQRTLDMVCPSDLVFCGQSCDYKHNVKGCETTNAPSSLGQPITVSTTTSVPSVVAKASGACVVTGERYATAPCANEYFECVSGVIISKFCLSGEVFDRALQQCTARNPLCSDSIDEVIFDGLPRTCELGEVKSRGQCLVTYFECTEARRFALSRCIQGYSFDPVFKKCRETELVIDCMPGVIPLDESNVVAVSEVTKSESVFVPAKEHVKDAFQIPIRALNTRTLPLGHGQTSANTLPFFTSYNDVPNRRVPVVGVALDGGEGNAEGSETGMVKRIKRGGEEIVESNWPVQCAVLPDGSYGLSEGCSDKYVKCTNGEAVVMPCSAGLAYHARKESCDYFYNVHACDAPRPPYDLLTAIKEHVGDIPKEALVIAREGCKANGSFGLGCSRYFILCSGGQQNVMTCPSDLIFDDKKKICIHRRLVRACNTPASATTPAPEVPQPTSVDCRGVTNGVYASQCANFFVTCSEGQSTKSFCAFGYQYDLTASRCISAKTCGKTIPSPRGGKCEGIMKGFVAEKPCSREYFSCYKGSPQQMQCDYSLFFSDKEKKCVSYSECIELEGSSATREGNSVNYGFCVSKSDGKYRHPSDCGKVVVCIRSEDFEYPSCPEGLVFNERTSACDYVANVPECAKETAPKLEELCRGKPHGTFVEYRRCSQEYYRCVWGVPEKMHCPDNTVFNFVLSVCDYKENISVCRE